jgi:DNA-binding response OmpR family regulator
VLDLDAHTATQKGVLLYLSKTEFDILSVLMTNAGQIITRRQIELALYGNDRQVESNSVEVHIHNLRGKIAGKVLKTIRGVGYILGPQA